MVKDHKGEDVLVCKGDELVIDWLDNARKYLKKHGDWTQVIHVLEHLPWQAETDHTFFVKGTQGLEELSKKTTMNQLKEM